MAILEVLQWPDARLKRASAPVDLDDLGMGAAPNRVEFRRRVRDLVDTLAAEGGLGLAAPQVGWMERVIAVADSRVLLEEQRLSNVPVVVMVNPVLLKPSFEGEPMTRNEGCLSFRGAVAPIARRERCRVRWWTIAGEELDHEFGEWDGRCIQHEVEHLDGRTMLDLLPEAGSVRFLADATRVAQGSRK
jgi:peptide deformylase